MKEKGIQDHTEYDPATGRSWNLPPQRVKATGYTYRYFAEHLRPGHLGGIWPCGLPGGLGSWTGECRILPVIAPAIFRLSTGRWESGFLKDQDPTIPAPQFVTIDFAARPSPLPLVTGVVHYDFDGDGFYDVGEGWAASK